jgi:peptide-methionine (S)-S-oxide reductase
MLRRRFIALAGSLLAGALAMPPVASAQRAGTAVFAGGCFWTVEYGFEKIPGVISAVSGYSGGAERNPTYKDVAGARTGHLEAVKVTYDPSRISYRQLVDAFWRMIDPTDDQGQACDIGPSYRTAIFVGSPAERAAAEASKAAIDTGSRKGKIVTRILAQKTFWPAEFEHQDFAKKHPADYEDYRVGCGRDRILARIWADKRG